MLDETPRQRAFVLSGADFLGWGSHALGGHLGSARTQETELPAIERTGRVITLIRFATPVAVS